MTDADGDFVADGMNLMVHRMPLARSAVALLAAVLALRLQYHQMHNAGSAKHSGVINHSLGPGPLALTPMSSLSLRLT